MTPIFKWTSIVVFSLFTFAAIAWWLIGPHWRVLLSDPPENINVLFWNLSQRDAGFQVIDQSSLLVKSHEILPSNNPRDIGPGGFIYFKEDMDVFFEEQRLAGLLILHKGRVRYERYGLGHSADGRWTSFSVAKSVTSSLVGAAIKDGYIDSINDSVSIYVNGLQGSVYDNVSIAQLLTMTSGVEWNEDYSDPNSDVAKFNFHIAQDDLPQIVSYMKGLSRAHPAGEVWNYSTGETNLIGILVSQATGYALADYLQEKIWQPFGMADKATWLLGPDNNEISGCCIQASLRDFARYGLFILEDGYVNGESILPEGWIETATQKQANIGRPGSGYGYQWWTFDDGSFTARGIFGQTIYIDPARELVLAFNGNWPTAMTANLDKERFEFINRVRSAIPIE